MEETKPKQKTPVSRQALLQELFEFLGGLPPLENTISLLEKTLPLLFKGSSGFFALRPNTSVVFNRIFEWGTPMARPHFLAEDCPSLQVGKPLLSTLEAQPPRHLKHTIQGLRLSIPLSCSSQSYGLLSIHYDPSENKIQPLTFQQWENIAKVLSPALSMYLFGLNSHLKIEKMQLRDGQTGLYHRIFFEEILQLEINRFKRTGIPLAFILISLDQLPPLQLDHSAQAIDLLVWQLANTLPHFVRSEDVLCRFSSTSFAILLPGAPKETATERARKLQMEMEAIRITHGGKHLETTASVVIIQTEFPDDTQHSLLTRAEKWLKDRNLSHLTDRI